MVIQELPAYLHIIVGLGILFVLVWALKLLRDLNKYD